MAFKFNPITGQLDLVGSSTGGSGVQTIVAGTNITVDATDPANPIVSASGGGGSVSLTSTEIDFGTTPISSKTFTITDGGVSPTNKILVFKNPTTATDRVGDDWEMDMAEFSAKSGTGQFTVAALSPYLMVGKRSIYYQII